MAPPDETRIVRSENLFEHTILPQNKDQIAKLFDDPRGVLELLTGLLTIDKQGLRIKIGHFAQSILQGNAEDANRASPTVWLTPPFDFDVISLFILT